MWNAGHFRLCYFCMWNNRVQSWKKKLLKKDIQAFKSIYLGKK